jgi:hypothetical protein
MRVFLICLELLLLLATSSVFAAGALATSDRQAVAALLGVSPDYASLIVSVSTLAELDAECPSCRNTPSASLGKQYTNALQEYQQGGTLVRYVVSGAKYYSRGYAVVRHGRVVATLLLAVS